MGRHVLIFAVLGGSGCFEDGIPMHGEGSTTSMMLVLSTSSGTTFIGGDTAESAGNTSGTQGAVEGTGGTQPEDTTDGATDLCTEGVLECREHVPYRCTDGVWIPRQACEGRSPVCSAGECVPVRIYGSWANIPVAGDPGSVRLVAQGFVPAAVRCADVDGNSVCVAGGIRP